MYRNGFMVAVKVGGQTIQEFDGKVTIPFNSEFKILLRNKIDKDAICKVYLDGKNVSELGDLVLRAQSSLELERFVSGWNIGNKFKFVPVSHDGVIDKSEVENGILECRFYKVNKKVSPEVVIREVIKYEPIIIDRTPVPSRWWDHTYPWWPQVTWCDTGDIGNNNITYLNNARVSGSITEIKYQDGQLEKSVQCFASNDGKGATIKGSKSEQRFEVASIDDIETEASAVITIKMVGCKAVPFKKIETNCKRCNHEWVAGEKYCSRCGNKRGNLLAVETKN